MSALPFAAGARNETERRLWLTCHALRSCRRQTFLSFLVGLLPEGSAVKNKRSATADRQPCSGFSMSSIIPFRFGTANERQEGDLSGLLSAGTESVNTSALAYERLIPPVRDWTNQEMADLARVQYLLSRAGVQLETDRGLSDEGDPWFVFCDAQGEVFVHICRMGMTYLLDGPSLDAPLRGRASMPSSKASSIAPRPKWPL